MLCFWTRVYGIDSTTADKNFFICHATKINTLKLMKLVHMKVVWIIVFAHEYSRPSAAAVAGHTEFGGVHGEGG